MPDHQGSPINLIHGQINPIPRIDTYLRLDIPRGLFSVVSPFEILKALLPSSILAICHAHLILLDLTAFIILGERYKL
jgi:hypothetical protein